MPTISFSGLASGIDSDSLIKATSDATRKQRVEPNETKVSDLTATDTNLDTLSDKLEALRTKIKAFASLSGGGLVKQGTSSDETVVAATATNSATNGTYSVTATALAKNETYSFRSTAGAYTSPDGLIASGTAGGDVVIKVGPPSSPVQTITIAVSATTTLSQFVTSFNNQATKAEASIVNVGTTASPDYRIVLTSNKTGTAEGALDVTVPVALTSVNAFNSNSEDNAADASFSITGIGTITRPTNAISDVITGVTFNLKALGSATVTIADDIPGTTSKVQEFVDAWNEVVIFVAENNLVTRQEEGATVTNIFSPLSSTRIDDNALINLRSALSGVHSTQGENTATTSDDPVIRIFSDLGVTTERDGTLKFDSDIFASALASEPTNVDEILTSFADTTSTTGGTIDIYTRFNGLIDQAVKGNKTQIQDLNRRIGEAEAQITKTEEIMRARFARLESTISKLQGQQQSLTSALAGLGR